MIKDRTAVLIAPISLIRCCLYFILLRNACDLARAALVLLQVPWGRIDGVADGFAGDE
jgi:hypothetical protein